MSYNRFTVNLTYVEGIHPLAFYIIYFFDFLLYVDFPRVSPSAVLLSSADCLPVTYHRDVSRTIPALYWSVCVCARDKSFRNMGLCCTVFSLQVYRLSVPIRLSVGLKMEKETTAVKLCLLRLWS